LVWLFYSLAAEPKGPAIGGSNARKPKIAPLEGQFRRFLAGHPTNTSPGPIYRSWARLATKQGNPNRRFIYCMAGSLTGSSGLAASFHHQPVSALRHMVRAR